MAHRLGVPLAVEKEEGPTFRLTFLGIQIDTVEGVLSPGEARADMPRVTILGW